MLQVATKFCLEIFCGPSSKSIFECENASYWIIGCKLEFLPVVLNYQLNYAFCFSEMKLVCNKDCYFSSFSLFEQFYPPRHQFYHCAWSYHF